MEPEIVKNRGLSSVSERRLKDDWATLGPRVRWTDLEEGSISSCGSSRWVARLKPENEGFRLSEGLEGATIGRRSAAPMCLRRGRMAVRA